MLARLILALTVIPLVELLILLKLAEAVSWGPTIALVIVTGVVGAALARREGVRALARIQEVANSGQAPTLPMVEAVMILVAGVVLVTPGILTDLAGFVLLIPPFRRRIARRAVDAISRRVVVMHPGGFSSAVSGTQGETSETGDPFIDVPGEGRDVSGRGGHAGGG